MNWKYIIVDDGEIAKGIVFPPTIQHKVMAQQCLALGKTIGAGFIHLDSEPVCHGESDSLKLKARPDDAQYFMGIAR